MKYWLLNLLFLVTCAPAIAQNATQSAIIGKNERPTPAALLADSKYLNVYDPNSRSDAKVAKIETHLSGIIVGLEKAYPGATYAFLGRDMALVADAVDAFYLSIGQTDRVTRINFSTASLQGATDELIFKYLAQIGLVGDNRPDPRNFVLIDITSYSTQGQNNAAFPSQARFIFESVINKMKRMGLSEFEIVNRINVATFHPSASKSVKLVPGTDNNSTLIQDQAESLKTNGKIDRITFIEGTKDIGYLSEWTGPFGPMKLGPNGWITTEPTGSKTESHKATILAQIVAVMEMARSATMKTKIMDLAARFGVKFNAPTKDPAREIAPIEVVEVPKVDSALQFTNDIAKLTAELPSLPKDRDYDKANAYNVTLKLTAAGLKTFLTLANPDAANTSTYFEQAIPALMALYKQDKVGARDFRRILAHILTLKELNNLEIINLIKAEYKNVLPLEIMLGRNGEREKYSKQGGLGEANYKKLIDNGSLPTSCKFVYQSN